MLAGFRVLNIYQNYPYYSLVPYYIYTITYPKTLLKETAPIVDAEILLNPRFEGLIYQGFIHRFVAILSNRGSNGKSHKKE